MVQYIALNELFRLVVGFKKLRKVHNNALINEYYYYLVYL